MPEPSTAYLASFRARIRPDAGPERDPATLEPIPAGLIVPTGVLDAPATRPDGLAIPPAPLCRRCGTSRVTIADWEGVCRQCRLERRD